MNAPGPILEFRSVRWDRAAGAAWDAGLDDLSLRLGPGRRMTVVLERDRPRHPLPDLACGLLAPDAGTILFLGADWAQRTPDEAAAQRGRIGQVFSGAGWLSNLDLDENITLPLRYHARMRPAAARGAAMEWARFFGLDALPSGRPARAGREALQLAQWIRAFSARPDLLLLDRPDDGLCDALRARFSEAVAREQARGAAVLWLTEGPAPGGAAAARCRADRIEWPDEPRGDTP